jgi:hypothetical protein
MSEKRTVDAEGNVYKGDLLYGKRHGHGTLVYAQTRDVYQGDFDDDLPHGSGKYFRADEGGKGIFEGLWNHGELEQVKKGRARIEDENGDIYEGGFNHWKRHGKGELTTANGETYVGQFENGVRSGFGLLTYADGTEFEGLFKNGKYDTHHKECSPKFLIVLTIIASIL